MTQPATDTCHHIHALFDQRCAAQPHHTFLFMPNGTLTLKQARDAYLASLGKDEPSDRKP